MVLLRDTMKALNGEAVKVGLPKAEAEAIDVKRVMGDIMKTNSRGITIPAKDETRAEAAKALWRHVDDITVLKQGATDRSRQDAEAAVDRRIATLYDDVKDQAAAAIDEHYREQIKPVCDKIDAVIAGILKGNEVYASSMEQIGKLEKAIEKAASAEVMTKEKLEADLNFRSKHSWFVEKYDELQKQLREQESSREKLAKLQKEVYETAEPEDKSSPQYTYWKQSKERFENENTRSKSTQQDYINRLSTDIETMRKGIKHKYVYAQEKGRILLEKQWFDKDSTQGPAEIANALTKIVNSMQKEAPLGVPCHDKMQATMIDGVHWGTELEKPGYMWSKDDGTGNLVEIPAMKEDFMSQSKTIAATVRQYLPADVREDVKPGVVYVPKGASDSEQMAIELKEDDGVGLLRVLYRKYVVKDVYYSTRVLGDIHDSPTHMTSGDPIHRLRERTYKYLEEAARLQLQVPAVDFIAMKTTLSKRFENIKGLLDVVQKATYKTEANENALQKYKAMITELQSAYKTVQSQEQAGTDARIDWTQFWASHKIRAAHAVKKDKGAKPQSEGTKEAHYAAGGSGKGESHDDKRRDERHEDKYREQRRSSRSRSPWRREREEGRGRSRSRTPPPPPPHHSDRHQQPRDYKEPPRDVRRDPPRDARRDPPRDIRRDPPRDDRRERDERRDPYRGGGRQRSGSQHTVRFRPGGGTEQRPRQRRAYYCTANECGNRAAENGEHANVLCQMHADEEERYYDAPQHHHNPYDGREDDSWR